MIFARECLIINKEGIKNEVRNLVRIASRISVRIKSLSIMRFPKVQGCKNGSTSNHLSNIFITVIISIKQCRIKTAFLQTKGQTKSYMLISM